MDMDRILDNINQSADLKNLSIKELKELCSQIREYMIECCSKNPGHLGASLGAVELAVAIHYVFDTPNDKLVWDVGHQAYAHKIITGRREAFLNNRKYNGISGFPKMSESEYDAFGAGHTSTSISAALGLAEAARMSGQKRKCIAVIGDGALTGGMAFEALNNAGAMKSDILVILNDNQISIDKNVGALHNYLVKISTSPTYNRLKNGIWNFIGSNKLRRLLQKITLSAKLAIVKSGSVFEGLGFRYFGMIDGNDIGELVTTLQNMKGIRGPKLLHVRTVKGKGYKPAEKQQSVWHAPGKFDIETGERVKPSVKRYKYQEIFGETITELARTNPKIVGITPAMASGCSLNIMMKEFPDRTYDVGIAEQHAVTFSAGLAAGGMLPFCNVYSTFMQRAYDSIIHDVALQNLKVVFCIDRGGLVGEDGATHHGAFDLAYFRLVPNMIIAAPMDEVEMRNMLYSATQPQYGPVVIRYPRGECEGLDWKKEFSYIEVGKARLLADGAKVALLSLGTIGNRAAGAAVRVAEQSGNRVLHYDMRFLKPIDTGAIDRAAQTCDIIITVEDGTVVGGLHGAVSEYLSEKGYKGKVLKCGIPDRFVEQGTIDELMSECQYNTDDLQKIIEKSFNFF
ncbi:MAG: 1-deoxy-D-xylulose-5-phosphate synthase [Bacteroidales bacterium]|nr:1-deoxy-D-xylulose-5-phosphate synthase [Bacteroidales bacterium]